MWCKLVSCWGKVKLRINKNCLLIALAMFYVSAKLTCNPLFFRQINLNFPIFHFGLKIIASSLVFPIIYILSDFIYMLSSRGITIFIIIMGIVCDGLFSFCIRYITTLSMPNIMSNAQMINTNAINVIGAQVWGLYLHGLIATIVANIFEVLIFAFIFKKINNFFISTIISVAITLTFHNTITDYPILINQNKDAIKIILNGLFINISILTIYAGLISSLLWVRNIKFSK